MLFSHKTNKIHKKAKHAIPAATISKFQYAVYLS